MYKEWGDTTVHINAHQLTNWSIGVDYYHMYEHPENILAAKVLILGLGFCNITITRWQQWTSKNS
jgi:hypothetical protein